MRKKLKPWAMPYNRSWHEWFAWYPVTCHTLGYHDNPIESDWKNGSATYRVWWEVVMQRAVVDGAELFWQYELRG